jgi:hypothetical protein
MISYGVSVRGPLPPGLALKLAQAHALAIQKRPTRAANARVGEGAPDAARAPH